MDSWYGTTEELWFPEREFRGTPWSNPAMYKKWSPSTYIKRWKTPTLIVHGQHDYRVTVGQGMQLFTALQRMGVRCVMISGDNAQAAQAIATRLGITGELLHALMPRVAQISMNTSFRMFPDSDAAKGAKDGAKPSLSPEAIAMQQMMKGIHF